MSEFQKETRYIVLKLSKLTDHQKTALGAVLAEIDLDESAMPDCVVVEQDWPNYDETWAAIQAISEGGFVSRKELVAQVVGLKGLILKLRDRWWPFVHGAVSASNTAKNLLKESEILLVATPEYHLAKLQEQSVRKGFVAGFKRRSALGPLRKLWSDEEIIELANEHLKGSQVQDGNHD